jgi:hypothetical protein
MISKFLLIFLGIYIVLNSTYGGEHRRNRTNTTIYTPTGDIDEYYDDYDYRISDGYKHKLNQLFRYCFTLLIIFCFY